jgi:recombination associated protein RdgC
VGALRGSLSYLRFFVDGEAHPSAGAHYEKSLQSRRFLPLSPTGETMESAGWVPLEAPFDDDTKLTRDLFLFGELIAVAYREDKYAIPRPLLQRETKKRLEKIVREEKKDAGELSRAFIKAVEADVLVELKRRTIPRSKLVDVVWDVARREVRVFGRGTIATERVASLFERTFQVRVELGSYAARAFAIDLGTRNQAVLERLSPGWLFPDALRRDPSEPGAGDDEEEPTGKRELQS